MFVMINPLFHPYAGMIRIRLEGIISACKSRHPLKSAAKLYKNPRTAKRFRDYFSFYLFRPYLRPIRASTTLTT